MCSTFLLIIGLFLIVVGGIYRKAAKMENENKREERGNEQQTRTIQEISSKIL